jgi:beta-lactamase regulating signal transducer with metallopeptidase domain
MLTILALPAAQRVAWALVHFLWQGLLLGLLAWGILALMRRKKAQLRYLVACGFLVACLAAPVATCFRLAPRPASLLLIEPASFFDAESGGQVNAGSEPTLQAGMPKMASWVFRLRSALLPVLPWIFGIWLAGVGFFSIRSVGGWIWLQRIKARGVAIVDPYWHDHLLEMAQSVGIRRVVRFLETDSITSPLASGLLKPVVMVPLGFLTNLDPLAVEAVLAHELAHIRRLDVLVNGCQCVIETLLFFHPAVWWISRRIRIEREHCCDDAAVEACGDPILFAETLNRLDTMRGLHRSLAASATGGNLMERIRRLLVPEPQPIRFTAPSLSMVVAFFLGATVFAAQQEGVQKTIRELPARLLEATGSTLDRSGKQTSEVLDVLDQFGPQSGDFPEASWMGPLPHSRPGPPIPPLPQTLQEIVPPVPIAPQVSESSDAPIIIQEDSFGKTTLKAPPPPTALVEVMAPESKGEPGNAFWPESVSAVGAASLPFSAHPPGFNGMGDINAYRVLRLVIRPGERAQFRMQAEGSKVVMEARIPHSTPSLEWRQALRYANYLPRQIRSGRFDISNPTTEPQVLDLMLYGAHGYSYRIDLVRTAGSPSGQ